MFRRVEIRNFKSLADVTVDLGEFTVLVGANGAGKSSFLQALEVFSWGITHESINDAFAENGVDFRDLVHLRAPKATIALNAEVEVQPFNDAPLETVSLWMELSKRRHVYLRESVVPGRFEVHEDASRELPYGVVSQRRERIAWEGDSEPIQHTNVALGHSMLRDVYFAHDSAAQFPILHRLAEQFMDYVHYEIWGPERLRIPSATNSDRQQHVRGLRLGKRGDELPRLLRWIRKREDRWESLHEELRGSYPAIREIRFRRGLDGEVGLLFGESRQAGSTLWYRPSQMSDGFLRLLGLLAIKYQPKPLAVLGYEEPENGLHPSALNECVRHLKEIARRGTQVIITTHSPYLLNHVIEDKETPKATLRLVIRDEAGNTTVSQPDPAKIKKAHVQGFGIGELWGMLLDEKALVQS